MKHAYAFIHRIESNSQSQVTYYSFAIPFDQNIFWLDISMSDWPLAASAVNFFVQIFEPRDRRENQQNGVGGGESGAG